MTITYQSDLTRLLKAIDGIGQDPADGKPLLEQAERFLGELVEIHRRTTFHLRMIQSVLLNFNKDDTADDINDIYSWYSCYRREIWEYNDISIVPFPSIPEYEDLRGIVPY